MGVSAGARDIESLHVPAVIRGLTWHSAALCARRSPLIAQHIIRRRRQFMQLFQPFASFAIVPSIDLQSNFDGKWELTFPFSHC